MMTTTNAAAPAEDRAWGRAEVAQYLRISIRQVANLRSKDPSFPQPRMVGRKPLWAPESIRAWLAPPTVPVLSPAIRDRRSRGVR